MICNIDKHRHLNVLAAHTRTYLNQLPLDPIVDVCFVDRELEEINPGYDSPLELAGGKRPPVVPVLMSCLVAVNFVVYQLTRNSQGVVFERI